MTERESGIGRLLQRARSDRKHVQALKELRRNIVVMFTDIHGSTAYVEKHGEAAGQAMMQRCKSILRAIVEEHGGRVIKVIGDGTLAIFDDCGESIKTAIGMQHALQAVANAKPEGNGIAIRIGIHYDNGVVRDGDVFGDVVNVASRIESIAQARQIVISEAVYKTVTNRGFIVRKVGRFLLKSKTTEATLYEVLWKSTKGSGSGIPSHMDRIPMQRFRLQVMDQAWKVKAEYSLADGIAVGRTEGDVKFPEDLPMAPASMRVFIKFGQVFVKDLSEGGESIFIRIAAAYTLQHDDVVLMGRHLFKFREVWGAMAAGAELGIDIAEVNRSLEEPVAGLKCIYPREEMGAQFPITDAEVTFGRAKGTYTFREDKMMSRSHARVLQRAEDFVIEDLGSRNGTFVKLRGTAPLAANSVIVVSNQVLRVVGV